MPILTDEERIGTIVGNKYRLNKILGRGGMGVVYAGEHTGTGRGVATRRVWDTNIRYGGQHFGASWIEHQKFAHAVREGLPAEISLEEGLRSVATGMAAHRSIETGLPVLMSDIIPAVL